jgi:hypothetical protein
VHRERGGVELSKDGREVGRFTNREDNRRVESAIQKDERRTFIRGRVPLAVADELGAEVANRICGPRRVTTEKRMNTNEIRDAWHR